MSLHGLLRLALLRLSGARVRGCWQLVLGRGVRGGRRALIDARAATIHIGDGVRIARDATVLTAGLLEERRADATASGSGPVVIEAGAWLGPQCVVMPGARIGAGSIVATAAVVHGDVAPHAIVAGAPARLIGWRRAGDCLEFLPKAAQPAPTTHADKTTPGMSP